MSGRAKPDNRKHHLAPTPGEVVVEKDSHVSADQSPGQVAETADDIFGEVNRDRVHAHPDEWLAPAAHLPNIHNQIKQAEQDGAVTPGDEHIGGGPNLFDDGKLQVP